VKKFFWENVVCRFGVPRTLIVDNGKQFNSNKFKEFCTSIGTKLAFVSVYHPESNGAVERANRAVFSAISKTLFNLRKGKWVEELRRLSGHTTPQFPEQQASPPSSYSMEKKPCYQKRSSMKASAQCSRPWWMTRNIQSKWSKVSG
jgi:transposase InsO family protein